LILSRAATARMITKNASVIVIVETIIVTRAVVKNHSCIKYLGPLSEVLTMRLDYFTCKF
jgi:hypothetical protein